MIRDVRAHKRVERVDIGFVCRVDARQIRAQQHLDRFRCRDGSAARIVARKGLHVAVRERADPAVSIGNDRQVAENRLDGCRADDDINRAVDV